MHQKKGVMSLAVPVLALVVSGLALGCQPGVEEPSAPEEAIPTMDPYLAIWNDGSLDLVDELYAPDFVWHVVDIAEDAHVGEEALATGQFLVGAGDRSQQQAGHDEHAQGGPYVATSRRARRQ